MKMIEWWRYKVADSRRGGCFPVSRSAVLGLVCRFVPLSTTMKARIHERPRLVLNRVVQGCSQRFTQQCGGVHCRELIDFRIQPGTYSKYLVTINYMA
jgi:hypothetical protein